MKIEQNYLSTVIFSLIGLLIASLVVFIAVQFWYFYTESQHVQMVIREIGQSYDNRIEKIDKETPANKDPDRQVIRLSFLKEIKQQEAWEWSHERVNRRYATWVVVAEWFIQFFILFLAILNERVTSREHEASYGVMRTAVAMIVIFSAVAIALPAVSSKLGFESRQRLHDFRAHQLSFLLVELESTAIDPKNAWIRYQDLYRQSPSTYGNLPGF